MRQTNSDLLAVSLLAFASALVAFFNADIPIVRAALGISLVLFVPGYALLAALVPGYELRVLERALFVIGSSIALAVSGGVLLNATPWGLNANTWAWLLSSITLGASAVAWKRRVVRAAPHAGSRVSFRWDEAWLMGCAVVLAALAFFVNQLPAPARGDEGYTLLWIQPDRAADLKRVQIGIQSSELARTRYTLQLQVAGETVQEWDSLELQPGETWQVHAQVFSMTNAANIQAVLYRADTPNSVYRHVSLAR